MIEGEETWNNLELDICCSSDKQHTVTDWWLSDQKFQNFGSDNRIPWSLVLSQHSPTLNVIPNDITDTLNHIRLMIKVLFLMFGVLNSVRWFPSFFGYKKEAV